jgi:hypothetical protein
MAIPGTLRNSQNVYEGENGGYWTMGGYERFDGQPLPSEAIHATIELVGSDKLISYSDTYISVEADPPRTYSLTLRDGYYKDFSPRAPITVQGVTNSLRKCSGTVISYNPSTHVLVVRATYTSGHLGSHSNWRITQDAIATRSDITSGILTDWTATAAIIGVTPSGLVITKSSGSFTAGVLRVGTDVVGIATGPQILNAGSTAYSRAQYRKLAADYARADITEVPGSGDVLGVWHYNGKWYAFRNISDGSAAKMYVETADGWEEVVLGDEVYFTGGDVEPTIGQTLTGAASGATAKIEKLFESSGEWENDELVTNGTFAVGTGWTLGSGWTIGAGKATHTTGTDDIEQDIVLVPGQTYHTEFTVSGRTAGDVTIKIGGTAGTTRSADSRARRWSQGYPLSTAVNWS